MIYGNNNYINCQFPISSLSIYGNNNKFKLKSQVSNIIINGNFNKMDATNNNAYIYNIIFNGNENYIRKNSSTPYINNIQNGFNNQIINSNLSHLNNIQNYQTFNFNNSNFSININGQFMNIFQNFNPYNFNNNYLINIPMNQNINNTEINENNISSKEKEDFILELNEFQYKHINKYSSRKEENCTICLENFKGTDIIKEFSCKHIFHKKCLLKWLEKSNDCPLCKHNMIDDIKKIK